MKDMYMVGYKVRGIKNLDQDVSLSFYKKTIKMPIDTREYNIKGIYGMNGSGKSGIIFSADILRNILINNEYLNNPIVQKNLDAMINKKTKELYLEVEFLVEMRGVAFLYLYEIILKKNVTGKYVIDGERLGYKAATSRRDTFIPLFEIKNGEVVVIVSDIRDKMNDLFIRKTANLLSSASMSALFMNIVFASGEIDIDTHISFAYASLLALFMFGNKIHVYMDQSDDHTDFFLSNIFKTYNEKEYDDTYFESLMRSAYEMDKNRLNTLSAGTSIIAKDMFEKYKKAVSKLEDFLRIFKTDLCKIEIERKEDKDVYVCSLNMIYDTYSINAEFESTGIKKLIRLFTYLQEMAQGGIIFIDEFDSNLHDVYLCALLEYLMNYGEGQLCFTTHNVGPMDVLKRHSKSIDFLSTDHKVYPWITNGNYSPSKLYRNGMIEGSPFNVDAIDFIGVLDSMAEEND